MYYDAPVKFVMHHVSIIILEFVCVCMRACVHNPTNDLIKSKTCSRFTYLYTHNDAVRIWKEQKNL